MPARSVRWSPHRIRTFASWKGRDGRFSRAQVSVVLTQPHRADVGPMPGSKTSASAWAQRISMSNFTFRPILSSAGCRFDSPGNEEDILPEQGRKCNTARDPLIPTLSRHPKVAWTTALSACWTQTCIHARLTRPLPKTRQVRGESLEHQSPGRLPETRQPPSRSVTWVLASMVAFLRSTSVSNWRLTYWPSAVPGSAVT